MDLDNVNKKLGWTDYRLTKAENILNWWEIINSAYWMISMSTKPLTGLEKIRAKSSEQKQENKQINHDDWRECNSWKNTLVNYRIMIQPMIIFCTILPWLKIIKSEILWSGYNDLLRSANHYMIHFLMG